MADSCNVRVFCRFRPFNRRELALGADKGVEINLKPGQVELVEPASGKKREFPVDHCFEGDCHQLDVFKRIAAQSVDDIFDGFNGTIFAYGQTGCGKSFTMEGIPDPPIHRGITPRSFEHIFEECAVFEPVKAAQGFGGF